MSLPTATLPPLSKVAVIGAGSLGLAQVKQLIDRGVQKKDIVVYEARDDVGGIWRFEEDAEDPSVYYTQAGQPLYLTSAGLNNPHSIPPSPMYKSLRTNLPNYVMAFRDNPFDKGTDIFPAHHRIQDYLRRFGEVHGLAQKCSVHRLFHTPSPASDAERWTIQSETDGQPFEEKFSHVVIANGHYNQPFIPYIPGLWNFKGKIAHSQSWRSAAEYQGKKLLIVGAKSSGSDIAHDLSLANLALPDSSNKSKIYLSTRTIPAEVFPEPLEQWTKQVQIVPSLRSVSSSGVITFSDGMTLGPEELDVVLFATGYNFAYSFIDQTKDEPWKSHSVVSPRLAVSREGDAERPPPEKVQPGLEGRVGGSAVHHLDGSCEMFYLPDPTIAFIGLAYWVVPFRLSEVQSRVIAYAWTQARQIPAELPPIQKSEELEGNPHAIGMPAEWLNTNGWLKAIGEGGQDGPGWHEATEEWIQQRTTAKAFRKELYGY
ncbi:fad nad-binding domain-containing protein [Phaffia rhodozyma]|uniref:Fad nad-binding domain-containing protein n=1 Tax=Phaffia rhodozyma TaxID=264483 RepID=A0A0F7SRQ1_PHARH|nr:fad nad-binding domain-containing protein [Phaffia rhodozyma]